jgi:hypothetical protein
MGALAGRPHDFGIWRIRCELSYVLKAFNLLRVEDPQAHFVVKLTAALRAFGHSQALQLSKKPSWFFTSQGLRAIGVALG